MTKDQIKNIINKHVDYTEQEIYDAIDDAIDSLYTRDEVKDIVMKFCEWKAISYPSFAHPPYLTDRWKAFSESNLKP